MNKKELAQQKYNELAYDTLSRQSPYFIHQHLVDAFAAEHADENTPNIKLVFALVGLYLFLEKGYTGKEVQNAHVTIASKRKTWPKLPIPELKGDVTVFDVAALPKGDKRDEMIKKWCESIWKAYEIDHQAIKDLLEKELYN